MGTRSGFDTGRLIQGQMPRTHVGVVSPKCLSSNDAWQVIGVRSGIHQVILAA